MSTVGERCVLRWKEWIPLVTQQQRLRNLVQVIAYNIHVNNEKLALKKKRMYYYTLHLTPMSSPLFTSEEIESENPKWTELEIKGLYGSANGVVIRLWVRVPDEVDCVITVWGIYFSGLVYIGPRLSSTDSSLLYPNSIVLHMHGGYFTAPHCFLNPHPVTPRILSIQLNSGSVKPSYSVNMLLRLQSLQHAIKKESLATSVLQKEISVGMFASVCENSLNIRESATLRKLLNKQAPPKADPGQILSVKKEIENLRFKIKILAEQKDMIQLILQKKMSERNCLLEKNQDKESELMENFCCLRRELEKKREMKVQLAENKNQLAQTVTLLDLRRRELISELSYIYPIVELSDGRYTIRDVYLPNSEDFEGKDELMISVALGFVAHLVQMISYFLDVPTRYPICHFGSRSKIIDHITDSIPDKEREFPLYSRGKEKHSFNYGVYLLNKNIAQLRWYCGLSTSDLRHTLPNLQALMSLKKSDDVKRSLLIRKNRRSGLSFSLENGLDTVSHRQVNSDPQPYTSEKKVYQKSPPPFQDLASLMLLDILHPKNKRDVENTDVNQGLHNDKISIKISQENLSKVQNKNGRESEVHNKNGEESEIQNKSGEESEVPGLNPSHSNDNINDYRGDSTLHFLKYNT